CGKVFEFEDSEIEALQLRIAQKFGLKLASHRLDMYGHCEKKICEHRKN
ncbi:MAG: transcriptional repressor, partial [Oligoflexales bacterium]|nr:transcriptional repressor [Oligoflexales bacterium]